jgi:predicted Rossmann fold nucleotide-binding protein DprA/Smf involved in DNA uptake
VQRNKLIYALADAALVVSADFQKGGTWEGAIEQIERLQFVTVFVRNGERDGKGNRALIQRGGRPWPEPRNSAELIQVIKEAAASAAAEPKQETLSFALREQAAPSFSLNSGGTAAPTPVPAPLPPKTEKPKTAVDEPQRAQRTQR